MTVTEEPSRGAVRLSREVLAELLNRPTWHDQAACRGKRHLFFSRSKVRQAWAAEICRLCPVLEECRRFADDYNVAAGVWAGESRDRYG